MLKTLQKRIHMIEMLFSVSPINVIYGDSFALVNWIGKKLCWKREIFLMFFLFFFSSLGYRRIDEYTYTQEFINLKKKRSSILSGCKYQPIPMIRFHFLPLLISGPILLFLPSCNGNRRPSVRFSSLLGKLLPWNLHSNLDVSLIFHKFLFNEMSKSFKNIFLDNQTRLLDFWGPISHLLTRVIYADILKSLKKEKQSEWGASFP